ncbi:hypothetical protein NF867_05975 [Solitalea sp. MAHUQ-68]|uniref:Uncharacterized protein n=1 Tax=Solitalea agri TaxID=2953739 RepID=A0A9X2F0K9_9SPHI|nr:hypothetical protein [Solitalea agri]MCO4292407.1 hypothetical protein [Solitalea agri]
MPDSEDYHQLLQFSTRDLSVTEPNLPVFNSPEEQFQQLRKLIIERITVLMDSNFSTLINLLYRADVDEFKLKKALAENPDNPAEVIADAYIQRQLQKIETRKKYRK